MANPEPRELSTISVGPNFDLNTALVEQNRLEEPLSRLATVLERTVMTLQKLEQRVSALESSRPSTVPATQTRQQTGTQRRRTFLSFAD